MPQPALVTLEDTASEGLPAHSRSYRLREMYWQRTHAAAQVRKPVEGSDDPSLTGHARDFAALLEASDPFIQPEELIVGCHLVAPAEGSGLDLGYYNSHYPPGHELILRLGLPGIRDEARRRLQGESDPAKVDFLRAVEISYDAACQYVLDHARLADDLAACEAEPRRRAELERIAAICCELAAGPPTSFYAALQLFQFVRVLGGRGCIGRFDQWMWPFYRRDIETGRLTPAEAQELIECLFIKLNAFAEPNEASSPTYITNDDLRNIALAGQTPDGRDACNELTYLCLRTSARLMLPEPKLNVRFFPGSPPQQLEECCRLIASGANTLALFNDEVAIPALMRLGIPLEHARDYCNDGCSELILGGQSTIWFHVNDSLQALTETVLAAEGQPYATFDDLKAALKERLIAFMPQGPGEESAVTWPFFAATLADCLKEASPTAVRYSLRGAILAQVGNSADGLAAIRELIYERQTVQWGDLVAALKADYQGYEPLRQRLLNRAPKYGNDDDAVDALAQEIAEYFCDGVHARACNPPGRGPKRAAGLMCFAMEAKRYLPASPDGRRKGDLTASSFSPAVGMDRSGPTAVLKSAAKVDLTKASHGSVLDLALHSSVFNGDESLDKLAALIRSFLTMPCTATLQPNVLDRDTLLKARANPRDPQYRTLIVRVWGFSAVFVDLPADLQDHVLARTEHGLGG
jgi:formate C-acetyltransferase